MKELRGWASIGTLGYVLFLLFEGFMEEVEAVKRGRRLY
jgi:hypothetical protein